VSILPVGDAQPLSPREERLMSVAGLLARNDVQLMKALDELGYWPRPPDEQAPAV